MLESYPRPYFFEKLTRALNLSPIACILGPRQCGKTTLARQFTKDKQDVTYFDLSDAADYKTLQNPMLTLEPLRGLVVLDEVQKLPQIFSALRVLADREEQPAQFLILGSASLDIKMASAETLAGRIAFIDMGGFGLEEVNDDWQQLWLRGGFPRSFLAPDDSTSFEWRENFIRTFLERDIPALGLSLDTQTLQRFWSMLAHFHGKLFNASEMANAMGLSAITVKKYINLLTDTFLIYQIPPWHENLKKRQIKSVKIYFRDTGLLHFFHNIEDRMQLLRHPCAGFSWESFVLEQIVRKVGLRYTFFWQVHSGAELDIFVNKRNRRIGFELKLNEAPSSSKSMHIACENLKLDKLYVVYPGIRKYALGDKIETLPIGNLDSVLSEL